jgi:hypothetical protein
MRNTRKRTSEVDRRKAGGSAGGIFRSAIALGTLALVAAVLLASAAEARGGPRGPMGKDPGCVRECRIGADRCLHDLRDEVRACVAEQCPSERDAACSACEVDRESEACRGERAELRACREDCRESLGEAFGACKQEGRACVEACPDASRRDRACLRDCRAEGKACRGPASDALFACRGDCSDLFAAARAACEADRCGEACRTAREDARACKADCRASSALLFEGCADATRECAESCPLVE